MYVGESMPHIIRNSRMKTILFLVCASLITLHGQNSFANPSYDDGGFTPGAESAAAVGAGASEAESLPGIGMGLETAVTAMTSAQKILATIPPVNLPVQAKLMAAHVDYLASQKSCVSSHSTAAKACLESYSPNIAASMGAINTVMSALGVLGANNSCSEFSKLMNIANMGLTAYTTACTTTKGLCTSACSKAATSVATITQLAATAACSGGGIDLIHCNTQLAAYKAAIGTAAVDEAKVTPDNLSVASKNKVCGVNFSTMVTSAGAGIASLLRNAQTGNKCNQQTAATATVDCTDASQANTQTCLCQANPRLQGCGNSLEKAGAASTNAGTVASAANTSNADKSSPTLGGAQAETTTANNSGSSGGSAGGGNGPGANIGGGSGIGGGGDSAKAAGAGGKSLDTNILNGSGGGGGGGWGSGRSTASTNSKYGAYLPGGAKDPNAASGLNAVAGEITGQAGKSNWEKVTDRYRDNKSSLLNNN